MRFKSLLIVWLLLSCFALRAQTRNDVFNYKAKITWLGLDFTATKLVGDKELWKDGDHTREILESLNYLMIKESEKFDVALAMDKPKMDQEVRVAMAHNGKLNMENMFADNLNDHFLKPADIQSIINEYDFKGLTGIGLLFNIETFNKPAEQSIIWITFVNMDTKEVLLTEKMTQSPSGFGLRNYWAGAIYKTLKDIRRSDYERWRKKYYRKNA